MPEERLPGLVFGVPDDDGVNVLAISVRQEIRERGAGGIILYPDGAIWDTGFRTPADQVILAHFKLNQYRDASHWQTWTFDRFSVEEGGQA